MDDQQRWGGNLSLAEGAARGARLLRNSLQETVEELRAFTRQIDEERIVHLDHVDLERTLLSTSDFPVQALVDELAVVLEEGGFLARVPAVGGGEFWNLATLSLRGEPREMHAGFLQPVVTTPIPIVLPDLVVAFLTIPGEDDLLDREHHSHFGWHYHYLDWRERRSDQILCWDTRATLDARKLHPLFHERHAEKRRGFAARPDVWGQVKRQSMHAACSADLGKWPLEAFKCASNDSKPVWPSGMALTVRVNNSKR